MCVSGRCQCFRGYEGADCALAAGSSPHGVLSASSGGSGGERGGGSGGARSGGGGGGASSQISAERCGGRCAGVCLARCRAQLEGAYSSPSSGRSCYAACSKTCLASCVVHKARDGARGAGTSASDEDVPLLALPAEPSPRGSRPTGEGKHPQPQTVEEGGDGAARPGLSSAVAGLERQAVDELAQLLSSLNDGRRKR